MKSQDIVLLFKMTSLYAQEENLFSQIEPEPQVKGLQKSIANRLADLSGSQYADDAIYYAQHLFAPMSDAGGWEGWLEPVPTTPVSSWKESYSLRALSAALGLSKSEISNSMARCREAGLLTNDYDTSLPKVNRRALLNITEHALKHFFPVKPGAIVRGIPTGFAAPALSKNLKSAGELIPVWPDPLGSERGQKIEPLYKTVPNAVKKDRILYHYLALVDAIRVGGPRECGVAIKLLKAGVGLK